MKRYSIDFYGDKMVEDKDGEYVKYDDAQKIREAYYGAWENAVVSGLLEIDLRDELEQQKYAFDNMQKLYLEIIVAANDNAEKLDTMTALAEKYKGQRDKLITTYKNHGKYNYHTDWFRAMNDIINWIQDENKEKE